MKIGLFHIFLFLFLTCLLLENIFNPLRYLKYILPFVAFAFYFFIDKAMINSKYFSYFKSFLFFYLLIVIFLAFKVLVLKEFNGRFIANSFFILFPLLFILALTPFFKEDKIKYNRKIGKIK